MRRKGRRADAARHIHEDSAEVRDYRFQDPNGFHWIGRETKTLCGHWFTDGTRSWREFAPPSREPHPPTKPRILSACRRRDKPRDTCRRASLREDLATAVYGPGVLLGMLLLSDVIRHPRRWCWLMRPAVAALGALPIPERSECDRMPV